MRQNRLLFCVLRRLGVVPNHRKSDKVRLSEFIDSYLAHKTSVGTAKNTILNSSTALKYFLSFRGNVGLSNIDKDFCSEFIQHLKHSPSGKSLSSSTAVSYLKSVNAAINYAVRHGLISSNPFDSLEREEKIFPTRKEREYLTLDEIRSLIDVECRHEEVKKAFLFSCFSGLRISDIRELRWEDLHKDGWGGALRRNNRSQNRPSTSCPSVWCRSSLSASRA